LKILFPFTKVTKPAKQELEKRVVDLEQKMNALLLQLEKQ
jgi:hypothetical protein